MTEQSKEADISWEAIYWEELRISTSQRLYDEARALHTAARGELNPEFCYHHALTELHDADQIAEEARTLLGDATR